MPSVDSQDKGGFLKNSSNEKDRKMNSSILLAANGIVSDTNPEVLQSGAPNNNNLNSMDDINKGMRPYEVAAPLSKDYATIAASQDMSKLGKRKISV